MKINNMIILALSLISTYGFAQPELSPTLQTLPEEMLLEPIVQGINQARTLGEAWEFIQNLALTGRQFAALTRDINVLDALANKIKDPQQELFDFAKIKGKIGENTAKMIITALLNAGAKVDAQDHRGKTALMYAANEGVVKELLNAGAKVDAQDDFAKTALMYAALAGNEGVVKELLNAGAKVDAQDGSKMTALIWAAKNGHEKVVEELLKVKADTEKIGQYETSGTALVWAARNGHEGIVKALINAGADLNKQDIFDRFSMTALMHAARRHNEGVVRELLKAGADVEKRSFQGTVLDDSEVPNRIKEIIQEGIEKRRQIKELKPSVFQQIDTIDKIQQEILDLDNKYRIAQLQQKADEAQIAQQQLIAQERNLKSKLDQFKKFMSNVTMNVTDEFGNTPLHKAVQSGNLKIVEWIFQFQPGLVKRKNSAGKTPIELAAGQPEILKLFIGLKQ